MALKIKYGDLKTQVLNLIKSRCQNIDSWRDMPAALRNGWYRDVSKGSGVEYNYCRSSVDDTIANVVASSTVESNFDSFMTTCGVNAKADQVITYRGLINFLSCAYRYIATHCVIITNEDTADWAVVWYNGSSSTPYTSIPVSSVSVAGDVVDYLQNS